MDFYTKGIFFNERKHYIQKVFPITNLFFTFVPQNFMEEKDIIQKASTLFMRYGIKSMTMDEMARQMGISKKTLYQFVDNKKDLVKKVMLQHIDTQQCHIQDVFNEKVNAIDALMEMTKVVSAEMKEIHPSVMFDLKKYHPEAFGILQEHKQSFIYRNIKNNLEVGIESGLYRDNLNPELLTHLYLSMVNSIMDPENLAGNDFSYADLHAEMMRYHIRGIASANGREYLKKKFKQEHV